MATSAAVTPSTATIAPSARPPTPGRAAGQHRTEQGEVDRVIRDAGPRCRCGSATGSSGVLAASFPTSREFPPGEQRFAQTLVGQAAQAFDRAAAADTRWEIAQTRQQSLLPTALPTLPRLG